MTQYEKDPTQEAKNIVLRQLNSAPKTRYQLSQKLRERDVEASVIDEVLDRFEEVQLIDDAQFAHDWVVSRHNARGLARRALSQELHQRGISGEVLELALEQLSDEDERVKAYELVTQRIARMTIADASQTDARRERDKIIRRLVGMLSRKGYSPGLSFNVVTDALDASKINHLDE